MANRSMFNIIDFARGAKVDFIALKDRPFDQMQFSRRIRARIAGIECWAATAEDTMLAKFEWSKMGSSERQYDDALQIARIQRTALDLEYLHRWAVELDVVPFLNRVLEEVGLAGEPRRDEPSD